MPIYGSGGEITVNGGNVVAKGAKGGAGIGGGWYGYGANVRINGGTVKAVGAYDSTIDAAGVGIGMGAYEKDDGNGPQNMKLEIGPNVVLMGSESEEGSLETISSENGDYARFLYMTTKTIIVPPTEEDLIKQKMIKYLNVDSGTADAIFEVAESNGIPISTVLLTESEITSLDSEKNPEGSFFNKLTAQITGRKKTSLKLSWSGIPYADGYMVFGTKANSGGKEYEPELLATIDNKDTLSWTNKSLKKKTYYKYIVLAYKNVNGTKMTVAASGFVLSPTSSSKLTVAKQVKVSNSKVTLKVGKTKKIKTSVVKAEKSKKLGKNGKLQFESADESIAKVSDTGKITAVKAGTTYIYAYAPNGKYKKIKVTVQ